MAVRNTVCMHAPILQQCCPPPQTLAIMLSSIPLTARGPVQICIFDIHALQERFYFSDNIIPRYPMILSSDNIIPRYPMLLHVYFYKINTGIP